MTDTNSPQADRYRHRTTEVQAVQWTGGNAQVLTAFCSPFDFQTLDPEDRIDDPAQTAAVRESEHGTWRGLAPGDWVVRRGQDIFDCSATDFVKLYEPPAAPVPAPAPTDRAALRDRIAEVLTTTSRAEWPYTPGQERFDHHKHGDRPGHTYSISCALCTGDVDRLADVMAAVLPDPADRAAILHEAAAAIQDVIDRDRARFPARSNDRAALGAARQIVLGLIDGPRHMAAEAQQPTDEDVVEAHRLALSSALGLGTGAPWDAIRERAAELHGGTEAQQQPDTEARTTWTPGPVAVDQAADWARQQPAAVEEHAAGTSTTCPVCKDQAPPRYPHICPGSDVNEEA